LRINTLIPPPFPLFKTVLELLQSDILQCLCRFFPHLLYILETLSFKVPLHSWKQEKIAGCQVQGVGGVRSHCHPVFREKLMHTQRCVGGSIVLMQKPLAWPPQFRAFSSHSITQSLEHFKVKLLVNSLTLCYEFKVDKPFDVKESDQHGFHIWFDLPHLLLVSEMMLFSIDLIVALSPGHTRNTMIHLLWWFWTKSLYQISVDLSFHCTHTNDWLSDPPRASEERISQQLVSCEVILLKFVDMSSTKLQSMLPTRRLFDNNPTLLHHEFF